VNTVGGSKGKANPNAHSDRTPRHERKLQIKQIKSAVVKGQPGTTKGRTKVKKGKKNGTGGQNARKKKKVKERTGTEHVQAGKPAFDERVDSSGRVGNQPGWGPNRVATEGRIKRINRLDGDQHHESTGSSPVGYKRKVA